MIESNEFVVCVNNAYFGDFSATGKGWQTRLDAALKEWIAQQPGGFHERR